MATTCLVPTLLSSAGPVSVIDTGLFPYAWPLIPAGGSASAIFVVIDDDTGQFPVMGDQALASMDVDIGNFIMVAHMQSQGNVTVVLTNLSSVAVMISGNMRITVLTELPSEVSDLPLDNFFLLSTVIGPTGGTLSYLDGIDASVYVIGTVIEFTLGGIGAGPATQYQLTTSIAAPGPGIVAALNVPTARWIQIL